MRGFRIGYSAFRSGVRLPTAVPLWIPAEGPDLSPGRSARLSSIDYLYPANPGYPVYENKEVTACMAVAG
jgi:hypothetical protein